jgi:hypothetical protein
MKLAPSLSIKKLSDREWAEQHYRQTIATVAAEIEARHGLKPDDHYKRVPDNASVRNSPVVSA